MADEARRALRELYAVPPDRFVAERDRRVRTARRAGDDRVVEALRAARRPTLAAWLLDEVARRDPAVVRDLLDLSGRFAAAYRDGDPSKVRKLSGRRRELVAAVTELVERVAAEEGRTVSAAVAEDVTGTVSAAIADPDVADLLRDGVLVRPARYSGFGPGLEALPTPPTGTRRGTGREGGADADHLPRDRRRTGAKRRADGKRTERERRRADDERRADGKRTERERRRADDERRAERERQRAEEAVRRAEEDHQRAADEENRARGRLDKLDAELERLRARLHATMRDRDKAARAHDRSGAALDRAAERLRRARDG